VCFVKFRLCKWKRRQFMLVGRQGFVRNCGMICECQGSKYCLKWKYY